MLTIAASQREEMAKTMPGTRMIAPCPNTSSWISIELRDEEENPIPNERYLIRLPDASTTEGRLDGAGYARVDCIVPGTCQISFPDIDAREWSPA
jgi:hypothetical protein